ncbi:MAG: TetR/AcrR family transcriptional regulator [Candidatus Palauibacterales bacterium]|nr:TetR/AcrR family transcriptional regulator [Candidatus Palauibacterales bacterium]
MATKREDILNSACDLYLAEGLEGFSMRQLARRVGVTAPALYRHYENKEAVLAEVVGEAYERLLRYLSRALEGDTPVERFRRAGRAYLDFALENARLYQMLYASRDVLGMERMSEEARSQACAIGQFWRDRVREVMDAGFLEEADPEQVAVTLWSHAHGLIALHLRGMLEADEEAFRNLYVASTRRVLRGLATDGARSRMSEREDPRLESVRE